MKATARIPTRTILAAVLMLAGVLVLAAGHFGGGSALTKAGLIVTLAGVLLELIFSTFHSRSAKRR